ncbi:hypothetical protein G5I_00109 [Acromyrmex echinatior]|uniref:Uncharacterized protein n=1 Tax=Acromyrmex echinatior TaxID=103372 RepID=F4W405_ACREC|nr:hypothetical protein G5I_00109 [Acromyrmex echinatior]
MEEGEARPTAKHPNRRVNTLLTVRGEARKPNGIRFGDLVGGLRRPPAATAASARSYSPLLFFTTSILTSYSRRRSHQHEQASRCNARLLPCRHVRADSFQGLSNALHKFRLESIEKREAITRVAFQLPLNTKWTSSSETLTFIRVSQSVVLAAVRTVTIILIAGLRTAACRAEVELRHDPTA